jgi:hypothetical protein
MLLRAFLLALSAAIMVLVEETGTLKEVLR